MQYHMNGYKAGSPDISLPANHIHKNPNKVDVLIVGCGPAGLTLAAQLSAFPDIAVRILDSKPGPLTVGQADGIACRSMEMFEAFGFADKVRREAYWVNETVFWRPDDNKGITRTGRIQDVEDGLSEQPHTILNQARVHDFYLETMKNAPNRLEPDYKQTLVSLRKSDFSDHPVTADIMRPEGKTETIAARYVVGCDGARSTVRKVLGLSLKGTAARQLWGVMDVLAVTDFPDIRLKSAIQSASAGSLLIIPREGGYMVRMYIELDALADEERAADRNVSPDMLIQKAQAILAPYYLDVKSVVWWSAYEIGQRVCERFDDGTHDPRIFIAGDACHTHSPKAGQGMNVSMADAYNLGWKLASVLRGQAMPRLLRTYSSERQAKAQELIEFDREMAHIFSTTSASDVFQRYFSKHARYTAGVETRYDPSMIVGCDTHQARAIGFRVGTRFHSAPVIRLADAKPMHLGHVIKADGRWRLFLFAGQDDTGQTDGGIAAIAKFLAEHPASPIKLYTPSEMDSDAVIDLRAVFQRPHKDLAFDQMPQLLRPRKGRYGLVDYENIYCADPKTEDIFDSRGILRSTGTMIIVRPDQYIAQVLPLNATADLCATFAAFMQPVNAT